MIKNEREMKRKIDKHKKKCKNICHHQLLHFVNLISNEYDKWKLYYD